MNKTESFDLSLTRLPAGFVATQWPGYFWNMVDQNLYSIKIDGVLKPLTHQKMFYDKWKGYFLPGGWNISVCGRRGRVTREEMKKIFPKASLIPVA